MPKRQFGTIEEFKNNLHKDGATLVEFSGSKVPCILVAPEEYHKILEQTYGKKIAADTLLDIFHDGQDVFVDVCIKFKGTTFDRNYLLYANDMMEFFEKLAETALLAISPDSQAYTNSQNIFMIQLPRRDAAELALEIIKSNAKARPQKLIVDETKSSTLTEKRSRKGSLSMDDQGVPHEIDSHYQMYGKHAWEVEYGERCPTCEKRIDEFGLCACGGSA
jgi:hypothetical protein